MGDVFIRQEAEIGNALQRARLCISCRRMRPRNELIRMTANVNGLVQITYLPGSGLSSDHHGRSAYVCPTESCVEQALKGTRLKQALEGRKRKNAPLRRTITWPLEPQLIQSLKTRCTDARKTCQNTQEKEGGE
jgi:uncharacterized protein